MSVSPFFVSFFADRQALTKTERLTTFAELVAVITDAKAATKDDAPWLKLARFGDKPTKGHASLRSNDNVLAVTGIEADYDAGSFGFYKAVGTAQYYGLAAILYTSASHTPDKPRWRVLCPTSKELKPEHRFGLVSRLHGLYAAVAENGPADVFAGESWVTSQAYYYGRVAGSRQYRVQAVDGTPIDLLDNLDATARGKPGGDPASPELGAGRELREDAELVRGVVTGEHYHLELTALAARYIGRRVDPVTVRGILCGLMLAQPESARDARWHDRYQSIDVIVSSAASKFAPEADRRRGIARLTHRMIRGGYSGPAIAAAVAAEAQVLGLLEDSALDIARNILREKLGGTKVA